MSSNITECELEHRLLAEVASRRQAFLQALQALDLELALQFQQLPADEWADHGALSAWPQLQPHITQLKQLDAALCQQLLGLYGLCSDCEAELSYELLYQDPCRQRCAQCELKHLNSQHTSWTL
ncbi:transcriptional regulator, TraR/DksA family protein [Oceanisphaera ostreae]|uniref:Transcriptional regulator, TraR/DksA family protein n=1 Tax=Oceanisphaera ostreae TaxID=914151 RepID=A0ABW3KGH5_9GAMM